MPSTKPEPGLTTGPAAMDMRPSSPAGPAAVNWIREYQAAVKGFDEMVDAEGKVRANWRGLASAIEGMGPTALQRRADEVREQLRFNGVTYHVYGDKRGADRQWSLDPLPVLIDSAAWRDLEIGLIQRAELLEAILRDIYGARQLVREGLLPALFLYSHPGFQRACAGTLDGVTRVLQVYSADLARGPDGSFRVVSDRCQNPSGYGYALENRMVLGRVLPSLFRHLGVHRLAPFYQSLRRGLMQAAPHGVEHPQIALLSPGPENETFFEQAYLASYLGLPLVRGGDLSARSDGVRLEGLGGSRMVDVILRRVDDAYCDPLELEGASLLGVPGLLQAVRNRRVTMANALGSGVLTGSGLMAFMPALCRKILGQDMRLQSTPTFWCGDKAQREEGFSQFEKMVVKPLYQGPRRSIWFVDTLTREQRERLILRIKAKPQLYLLQERAPLSTTPCFIGGQLEGRPWVLRSFLAAVDKTYEVMPGGLARASGKAGALAITNQEGGISKDTWIVASEPVAAEDPIEVSPPRVRLHRETTPLPGYAAENLFWLGRYQERLEAQARLWREALLLLAQDESEATAWPAGFERLLLAYQPGLNDERESIETALIASLSARDELGSPAFNLAALRRSARVVRELLSNDAWLSLHAWHEEGREIGEVEEKDRDGEKGAETRFDSGAALTHLDRLVVSLAGFSGLVSESMTHGPVRRFLQLGRRLERALLTSRCLWATFRIVGKEKGEAERGLLRGLLAVQDSVITYRNRYASDLAPSAVVDVLLCDDLNPRSVLAPLLYLAEDLSELPRMAGDQALEVERHTHQLIEAIRAFEPAAHEGITSPAGNEIFEHLLDKVESTLGQISDRLATDYFRQRPMTQTLKEWS